ncbi:beta-mannosidase [Reichenbachiella sp. 5M10]|uniref:glycoside hydrolase family 26 protein n=1 Tax=unclassified Reichenbachiella TaxID=2633076 RepID=UPI000C147F8A|nr:MULTISPECIES: glycosyl hydrolase [unclassified Reichenbachiella]PIB36234.1 beta-mannosidase [Reichenbachiella sp. 5M10]RJE72908.1 beta-mannosidase [Reichenbachiella sp. MSK19-1]
MEKHTLKIFASVLILASMLAVMPALAQYDLLDHKATKETKNLFNNLIKIADGQIMFGHQDDMAYGVGWEKIEGKSDVKDIVGSFPAVHGWDLGRIKTGKSLDGISIDDMREWMKSIYTRGGINTISLHWDNFATGGNSWDLTPAVKHILPGGSAHERYVQQLDELADFIQSVKVGKTMVPMIFRPFHEHNGDWFWWGKGLCTEEEYIAIWKFTVDYLRDEKKLHNLIYAFSPDASRMGTTNLEAGYLYGYPGDDYVDMLGIDDYWNVGRDANKLSLDEQKAVFVEILELVTRLADDKGKATAITETGLESITNPDWFDAHILSPIKSSDKIKMSYVLVWRNANEKHHYAPYPGHASVDGFKKFCADDAVLMEDDLNGMYRK